MRRWPPGIRTPPHALRRPESASRESNPPSAAFGGEKPDLRPTEYYPLRRALAGSRQSLPAGGVRRPTHDVHHRDRTGRTPAQQNPLVIRRQLHFVGLVRKGKSRELFPLIRTHHDEIVKVGGIRLQVRDGGGWLARARRVAACRDQ